MQVALPLRAQPLLANAIALSDTANYARIYPEAMHVQWQAS